MSGSLFSIEVFNTSRNVSENSQKETAYGAVG